MMKIVINRNGEYAGTGALRRLNDGSFRIEDCDAVLPEEGAYEEIEHRVGSRLLGDLVFRGVPYGFVTVGAAQYSWRVLP